LRDRVAKNEQIKVSKTQASQNKQKSRENFLELFQECSIPENELLSNLGLFIKRQDLSRILFMHELYRKALDIHGVAVEFGVRWGQNLAFFESFRGIYEPFNYNRLIIGFDTFSGFPSVDSRNGRSEAIVQGVYSVTKGYQDYLVQVLDYHEQESPISHIRKYRLIRGDAATEIEKYLSTNPETIIALAYFDLDLYEPTKKCLQAIKGHLTKGSVLGFDELNLHEFPGETKRFVNLITRPAS
jgi:hypothetical protein